MFHEASEWVNKHEYVSISSLQFELRRYRHRIRYLGNYRSGVQFQMTSPAGYFTRGKKKNG